MDRRAFLAALAATPLVAQTAHAQDPADFPSRPIRWIVPYLPGTGPDITARIVAEGMARELKASIIVENKAGAAGNLGAQIAARAPADGLTWIYSADPMSTSMRMYRKPGYDVMKDFVHVGRISDTDIMLVVNPESGIESVQDLLERARKNPGKLTYASGGIGSPAHMGTELMLHTAGVTALHVPYKGASESANAVMSKQVDFALTVSGVSVPYVQGGKLKALAVTGDRRNPLLPNVPTLKEAGIPVTLVAFGGISVPKGTPPAIVARIADALNKALAMPEVRGKLQAQGAIVAPSTPEQYASALHDQIGLAEHMMQVAHLQPQ